MGISRPIRNSSNSCSLIRDSAVVTILSAHLSNKSNSFINRSSLAKAAEEASRARRSASRARSLANLAARILRRRSLRRLERRLKSVSVIWISQALLCKVHSAQRLAEEWTRQSLSICWQWEQGLGITSPDSWMKRARDFR